MSVCNYISSDVGHDSWSFQKEDPCMHVFTQLFCHEQDGTQGQLLNRVQLI